jgi:hypothetical protein
MKETPRLESLFRKDPPHWGLRGDPHLWAEMRDAARGAALPESAAELEDVVRDLFLRLVGEPLGLNEFVFVPRFSHGGMSSGHVCREFWEEEAIPLLQSRLVRRSRA